MKIKHVMRELLEQAMLHPLPGEPVNVCTDPRWAVQPTAPAAEEPTTATPAPTEAAPEASGLAADAPAPAKKKKKKKEHNSIHPVENGREPRCRHFGVCGGCEYQHVPYARQTAAKVAVFRELAARQGLDALLPLDGLEVVGSPEEFGYRQRMDYVFAFEKAGLRERGSHKFVAALEECPLLGERGFAAFRRARDLALAEGLPCYNYLRNDGFLRYFVIRQSRTVAAGGSGQVMVSLVTKSRDYPEAMERVATTLLTEGLAHSVHWLLQETVSDVSFGDPHQHWGAECIEEQYAGKRFLIGPNTFFQANPAVAAQAYARIAEFAAEVSQAQGGGIQAIDAYSGTGVIAQLIAAGCGKVAAVENVPDNVRLARENLRNNNVPNVTLYEEDAGKFLAAGTVTPGLLVVNPPRSGLESKAVAALRKVGAPRVAYMSCNPATLLEDLRGLLGLTDITPEAQPAVLPFVDDHKPARPLKPAAPVEFGTRYRVVFLRLYDMFPQTRHWETLALLEAVPEA